MSLEIGIYDDVYQNMNNIKLNNKDPSDWCKQALGEKKSKFLGI